jgi:hypothetical protein
MRSIRAFLPAFALAMMLVVLGHDALMAANPHAQSPASADHAGHEPLDAACQQQEGVRPGSLDVGAHDIPGHAVLPPQLVLMRHVHADVAWDAPPRHPPDVSRALLQVFLN